mgnify:CR=1 FL=1
MSEKDKPATATIVRLVKCQEGHVHLLLEDDAGHAYAEIALSRVDAYDLVEDILGMLSNDDNVSDGPTIQ